jgi:hypothetical protein
MLLTMEVTEMDLAWAAGLLEGEGSFQAKLGSVPFIWCEMSDEDVVARLAGIFGGNYISHAKRQEHFKDTWSWSVVSSRAAKIMEILRPLMGRRRQSQIDVALAAWGERQRKIQERKDANAFRAVQAVEYYRLMDRPSMRRAGAKFGVSHVTIQNYIKIMSQ